MTCYVALDSHTEQLVCVLLTLFFILQCTAKFYMVLDNTAEFCDIPHRCANGDADKLDLFNLADAQAYPGKKKARAEEAI